MALVRSRPLLHPSRLPHVQTCKPFRMRTYEKCARKSFGMRTYEKCRGGPPSILILPCTPPRSLPPSPGRFSLRPTLGPATCSPPPPVANAHGAHRYGDPMTRTTLICPFNTNAGQCPSKGCATNLCPASESLTEASANATNSFFVQCPVKPAEDGISSVSPAQTWRRATWTFPQTNE